MASTATRELPFFLQGNYAPVDEEKTAFDLPVEGEIPAALRGLYLRNGPNPRSGTAPHWFFGDGMLHGVRLEEGRAAWYRNRWVKTRQLEDPTLNFVQPDGSVDRTIGVANTNVVGHAGRIFALVENAFPTEVTGELETCGIFDYGGKLDSAMTAHPKLCPDTGELHFFGYAFAPPWLTYHRVDAAGKLVQSEVIDIRGPAMIHDFAITEKHVIFMDLPIVFSPEHAMKGTLPYVWSDDYGARVGVMPRGGSNADVRWVEVDPCYVFHPLNAYDEGDGVVVDVARYAELFRGSPQDFDPAYLHRWTLDPAAGKVSEQALDDRPIEFPRVDERLGGKRHRYGYAVANLSAAQRGVDTPSENLIRYDLATGATQVHEFGPGNVPGEGVFVPASADAAEDEGFVLTYVYDSARDGSDLVILDAANLGDAPVAKVSLPQRVPFGFHGNWIPDVS